jgi:endonuclease/exonuclease/phosphatase family metal-dependent hydrolase
MNGQTDFQQIMRDIDSVPEVRNADLFLLQECAGTADGSSSIAKDLAGRLNMPYMFKAADPNGAGLMKGLGIVSRYPFHDAQIMQLEHIKLHFKSRDRIAMAVTVESPAGPIRVFNVHLDSRINKKQRLEQLTPVLEAADAVRLPCLIGGDLNTGRVLWVGHTLPVLGVQKQADAVKDLMAKHGFSTPFGGADTFPLFRLHLDWIYLRGLKPAGNGVTPMPFTDHHAIWLKLERPGAGRYASQIGGLTLPAHP